MMLQQHKMAGCFEGRLYSGLTQSTVEGASSVALYKHVNGDARLLGSSEKRSSAIVGRGSCQASNDVRRVGAGRQIQVHSNVLSAASLQQSPGSCSSRLHGGGCHI